eukprot:1130416-Amphidinium_carterae.1
MMRPDMPETALSGMHINSFVHRFGLNGNSGHAQQKSPGAGSGGALGFGFAGTDVAAEVSSNPNVTLSQVSSNPSVARSLYGSQSSSAWNITVPKQIAQISFNSDVIFDAT